MSPDFDRLLRESVHELAAEADPVDLSRPALRRARRMRRYRTVAAVSAAVVAVVLVAGIATAARLGRENRGDVEPAGTPTPSVTSSSATPSLDPDRVGPPTPPLAVVGGWKVRSAPYVFDEVIVYDDTIGRYRRFGSANTVLPSPDGRHVMIMGASSVVVRSFPDDRMVYKRELAAPDVRPVWSADSTRLAFVTSSPEGEKVRVAELPGGGETASDPVNCPDGCMLKWLEDGQHVRVYTGSQRTEVTVRDGKVGPPSSVRDDPCGSTVRAFRVDASSWVCVTPTGFAVTTTSGSVTKRIPFPTELGGFRAGTGGVNYVLFR